MEFRLLAVFIWAFCLNPIPALAQPPAPSSNHPALTKFLQSHYKPSFDDARPPQYAFVDLNGDGVKEASVYLREDVVRNRRLPNSDPGSPWILVQGRRENNYHATTHSRTYRHFERMPRYWRLGGGGGIRPGYEAELRFNGKTYPTNPSVPPARPLHARVPGEIAIAATQAGSPAR